MLHSKLIMSPSNNILALPLPPHLVELLLELIKIFHQRENLLELFFYLNICDICPVVLPLLLKLYLQLNYKA